MKNRLLTGEPMLSAAETTGHRLWLENGGRRKVEVLVRTRHGEIGRLHADCRASYAIQPPGY